MILSDRHTAETPPGTGGSRIVLRGAGLISPLGLGAWATFRALLDGRALADRCAAMPAGIDPVTLVRATGALSITQHISADPSVIIAEKVAREALAEARIDDPRVVPCVLGTSKGAIRAMMPAASNRASPPEAAARAVALGPCGLLASELQARLHMPVTHHIVAACASSLAALDRARRKLLHGDPHDRYLVVTAEAALWPLMIHSYQRLGVLAPLTPTSYLAQPMDEHRQGFMLAELGAAVLIQRTNHIQPGDIELLATATATEPHDLIRPAPVMCSQQHVLETMLTESGHAGPIDLLHPHCPGTPDHDPAELAMFAAAMPGRIHDVYANKGALGHGLGASGLVSLVLAYLCAKAKRRPPMPWLDHPIACGLPLSRDGQSLPTPSTHAVFAAGFGGHVAGAMIRRA